MSDGKRPPLVSGFPEPSGDLATELSDDEARRLMDMLGQEELPPLPTFPRGRPPGVGQDNDPAYSFPDGEYVRLYTVNLASPAPNNNRQIQIESHFSLNYGAAGVITFIWHDTKRGVTFARSTATKDPASEYRRTIAILPDGSTASLDPAGAIYA